MSKRHSKKRVRRNSSNNASNDNQYDFSQQVTWPARALVATSAAAATGRQRSNARNARNHAIDLISDDEDDMASRPHAAAAAHPAAYWSNVRGQPVSRGGAGAGAGVGAGAGAGIRAGIRAAVSGISDKRSDRLQAQHNDVEDHMNNDDADGGNEEYEDAANAQYVDAEYVNAVRAAGLDYRQILRDAASARAARAPKGSRPRSRAVSQKKQSTSKKKKKVSKKKESKYRDQFKEPTGTKKLHPTRKKRLKQNSGEGNEDEDEDEDNPHWHEDIFHLFETVYKPRRARHEAAHILQDHIDPVGVCKSTATCPHGDELCRLNPARYPCLQNRPIQLEPQQLRCVMHLLEHDELLADHIVGAGKTFIAVATSVCLLDRDPNMHCWMITPAGLRQNMKDALMAYGVQDLSRYHFMGHDEFYRALVGTSKKHAKLTPDILKNAFVAIDEVHGFRNPDGKRTNELLQAMQHAAKVLLMTATSAYNFPSDTCVILAMLYRTTNVFHLDRFNETVDSAVYHGDLRSARMLQELFRCMISMHTYVDPALFPEAVDEVVTLTMPAPFFKKYAIIEKAEEKKMKERYGDIDPTVFYNGLRQAVNDAQLDEDAASPKIEWILQCLQRNVDCQSVVYSAFLAKGTNQLATQLAARHISFGQIYGGMSDADRATAVKLYNDINAARRTRVMLLSKAGGEGLNLLRTEIMIGMEPGWQQAGADQFKGRGRRRGSHANMPAHRRKVRRYELILDKPNERRKLTDYMKPNFNAYEDEQHERIHEGVWETPSVDHYMFRMSKRKNDRNMRFMRLVEPGSIEYLNCIGSRGRAACDVIAPDRSIAHRLPVGTAASAAAATAVHMLARSNAAAAGGAATRPV